MNYTHIIAQAAQAAQDAQAPQGGMNFIVMIVLMVIMLYFITIRPNNKRQKELKARQDALKAGDKVITAGGIFGIVREVQDEAVKIEVSANVLIKVLKSSIMHTVGKDGSPEK